MNRLGHLQSFHRRLLPNVSLRRRRPMNHLKRDRRRVGFVYALSDVDYDRLVRFWMK